MAKIIFNTRDELISLDPDHVAIVKANGNYSDIIFINKRKAIIPMGISQVETALKDFKGKRSKFIRLGRSLIINHTLLYRIDVPKQMITLSDGSDDIIIKVAKSSIRAYKEAVVKSIKIKTKESADRKITLKKKEESL